MDPSSPSVTTLKRSVVINAPIEEVFHFHDNSENLLKITPPHIKVSIEESGPAGVGHIVKLNVRQFGLFTMKWVVRFTDYTPPTYLSDEQISGPFSYWKQERLLETVEGGTELTDVVHYKPPLGFLGAIANSLFIRREVEKMFRHRQSATKTLLENAS